MAAPLIPKGGRVAVVAPGHPFSDEGLAAGRALLESWGYSAVEAPNLRATHRYTAGTVAQRAADLQWALSADDLDAVWFARGGSGTGRLLDQLDWSRVVADRPVLGFSDATALFCGLWRRGLGVAVHAPVLHSLTRLPDADSVEALHLLLLGGLPALPVRHLAGPPAAVEAPLVGGNLSVLASLCGTPWQIDARGCALVLEDVGEPPYKVDRLLAQLELAGAFDGVAAVVVGELTGCRPPEDAAPAWTLDDLLADLLGPLGMPIFVDAPLGHGQRNRPFVWGRSLQLGGAADVA